MELCHRLFRQTLLYPVLKGIFPGVVGEILLKGGAEAPWEGERKGTLQTVFVAALDVEQLFLLRVSQQFWQSGLSLRVEFLPRIPF